VKLDDRQVAALLTAIGDDALEDDGLIFIKDAEFLPRPLRLSRNEGVALLGRDLHLSRLAFEAAGFDARPVEIGRPRVGAIRVHRQHDHVGCRRGSARGSEGDHDRPLKISRELWSISDVLGPNRRAFLPSRERPEQVG